MTKRSLQLIIGIALTPLLGCLAAVEYEAERSGTENETRTEEPGSAELPDPNALPAVEIGSCNLQPSWHTSLVTEMASPMNFDVAPDGRLLVQGERWRAAAFRGRDGQRLFSTEPWQRGSVDQGWHIRADIVRSHPGAQLSLRTLLTEQPLWTVELENDSYNSLVRMAPDASRVVVTSCREQRTLLHAFSVETGHLEFEAELSGGCLRAGMIYESALTTSRDGQQVAMLLGQDLVFVELQSGAVHRMSVALELSGEGFHYGDPSLVMSPEGDRLALVGRDRHLHQWSLPGFQTVGSQPEVGQVEVNRLSYMPGSISPLAISSDGELLAHITPDSQIAIIQSSDGALVASLELPDLEPAEGETLPRDEDGITLFGNQGNEPVALQFLADGSGLAASLAGGLALWRCDGAALPQSQHPMRVVLEAPSRLRVGQQATFTATHLGSDDLHGHAFFVNGEPMGEATTQRQMSWVPDAPGRYEVTVELNDGIATGSASATVVVSQGH